MESQTDRKTKRNHRYKDRQKGITDRKKDNKES